MERNEQLQAVWRLRFWIVGFAAAVALFGFVYSSSQSNRYTSNAVVQVVSGRESKGEFITQDEKLTLANFDGELARTTVVSKRAAKRYQSLVKAKGSELNGSAGAIDISARPAVAFLDFTATAGTPQDAAAFANAYAAEFTGYIDETRNVSKNDQVTDLNRSIDDLVSRQQGLAADSAEYLSLGRKLDALSEQAAIVQSQVTDSVRVIEPAARPFDRSSPKPLRDGVLAGIAAALIALVVAYARASFADRYQSAAEIARDIDLPLLAEVPRLPIDDRFVVESLRKLRTQVAFAMQQTRHPVVLFTSAMPGAGKSYLSRGVGRSFAEEGQRVIIVDADLRRPTQHSAYGVARSPGLTDLLSNASMTLAQLRGEHGSPHLVKAPGGEYYELLPAGEEMSDPAGALGSTQMANLIEQLRVRYDVTVFDTAPVVPVVDTLGLTRYVDGVVLVVDTKRDRRTDVRRAVQTLRAVDVKLLGFVHNGAAIEQERYGYYGEDATPRPSEVRA